MNNKFVELSLNFRLLNKDLKSQELGISFINEIKNINLTKDEILDLLKELYLYFDSIPEDNEEDKKVILIH